MEVKSLKSLGYGQGVGSARSFQSLRREFFPSFFEAHLYLGLKNRKGLYEERTAPFSIFFLSFFFFFFFFVFLGSYSRHNLWVMTGTPPSSIFEAHHLNLCLFVCLSFLGLHPRHMEVPRLGVQLELQPPAYTKATAMPDPSCLWDLHHSSLQRWIPNHWARPRIEPATPWFLVGFINHWAKTGTPHISLCFYHYIIFFPSCS